MRNSYGIGSFMRYAWPWGVFGEQGAALSLTGACCHPELKFGKAWKSEKHICTEHGSAELYGQMYKSIDF
ncbi:hypothetical protein TWF569_007078 [Orbilia oligospora]|uniref:Uncharacterized protein n=1 Tax=Orbilia oligospora TaxID=2813651 RepID=A0A7C8JBI5_ORBOL|nr:hypothetical protein TWF706_005601 [Orbilia oligospora]KAF3102400.1 hypothetical protein TWF102_004600 [Orbilia oligospora]KAF3144397.1 hypothetical protein TWF569_007078 [Orbilia oligospora]